MDWSKVKSAVASVDGLDVTFEDDGGQLGAVRLPYASQRSTGQRQPPHAEVEQQHRVVTCTWWQNNPAYTGPPQQLLSSYYQKVCQNGPIFMAKPSAVGQILTGFSIVDEKTPFLQQVCARIERFDGNQWVHVNGCTI